MVMSNWPVNINRQDGSDYGRPFRFRAFTDYKALAPRDYLRRDLSDDAVVISFSGRR